MPRRLSLSEPDHFTILHDLSRFLLLQWGTAGHYGPTYTNCGSGMADGGGRERLMETLIAFGIQTVCSWSVSTRVSIVRTIEQ